jgi:hypothetical protein
VFLRFVTANIHECSRRPQGVFTASYQLLDSGDLNQNERQRLREIHIWFNIHLPSPPEKFDADRAIFWFKSSAKESITRIWELVHLLREHSYLVEVHKCRHLANILYEDEFQVAAYPSKRDAKITVQ